MTCMLCNVHKFCFQGVGDEEEGNLFGGWGGWGRRMKVMHHSQTSLMLNSSQTFYILKCFNYHLKNFHSFSDTIVSKDNLTELLLL